MLTGRPASMSGEWKRCTSARLRHDSSPGSCVKMYPEETSAARSSPAGRPTTAAAASTTSATMQLFGTRTHTRVWRGPGSAMAQVTHWKSCSGSGTCTMLNESNFAFCAPHVPQQSTDLNWPEKSAMTTDQSRCICTSQYSAATSSSWRPQLSRSSMYRLCGMRFTSSLSPSRRAARNSCASCCSQPSNSGLNLHIARRSWSGTTDRVAFEISPHRSPKATATFPARPHSFDLSVWGCRSYVYCCAKYSRSSLVWSRHCSAAFM
mmetsp:Transcript_21759/g.61122  ORF Transcript_21759/g.61122 Transcript_21759/m.61122 type:complete len:264 (-) Transcript_21759:924-1715(-)